MKALRTIGTVIGAFLLPIIALFLCGGLVLYSTAGMLTDEALDGVAAVAMEEEAVREALGSVVADSLVSQLPIKGTSEERVILREAMTKAMERPSVQKAVADVIKDCIHELTSSNFDGELNLNEKTVVAMAENPEAMAEITAALLRSGLFGSIFSSDALTPDNPPDVSESSATSKTESTETTSTTKAEGTTATRPSDSTPDTHPSDTTSQTTPTETTASSQETTTPVTIENNSLMNMISGNGTAAEVLDALDENTLNTIMADSDVQLLIAEVMAKKFASSLFGGSAAIDMAGPIAELIEEKPALFEDAVKTYIPDEETKEAIIASAATEANARGVMPPSANLTENELVVYLLTLYEDEFNEQFNTVLSNLDLDSSDIDYAPSEDGTPSEQSNDTLIHFHEDQTKTINTYAGSVRFLGSVGFFLLLIAVFVVFYALSALFTQSFRYPLLFEGITAGIIGILLLVICALPVVSFIPIEAIGENAEIINALAVAIWSGLSKKLLIFGIISLVISLLCIGGYVLWTIKRAQKKSANKASADEPEAIPENNAETTPETEKAPLPQEAEAPESAE